MNRQQIGRLALREVRDQTNAYYAMPHTMKGAILLASVRTTMLRDNPGMFERWREMLQDAVTTIIKGATGITPTWPNPPQPAPEHERGQEPRDHDA